MCSPLLNFLRTGTLSIPPTTNEATVRSEADFYCITLPASDEESNQVRCDGLYLSFAPGATPREGAGDEESGGSEVRAYLIFEEEGRASLGRREANGQWSALRCRYRCLAGGLLLVHHDVHVSGLLGLNHATNGVATEPPLAATPEAPPAGAGGAPAEEDGGEEQDGLGQLELSAVVLGSSFIRAASEPPTQVPSFAALFSSPLLCGPLLCSPVLCSPLLSAPLRSLRSSPLLSAPLRSSPLLSAPLLASHLSAVLCTSLLMGFEPCCDQV